MSKYQDKHFHPYIPTNIQCPICNKWYSIDLEDCEIFIDEIGADYYLA